MIETEIYQTLIKIILTSFLFFYLSGGFVSNCESINEKTNEKRCDLKNYWWGKLIILLAVGSMLVCLFSTIVFIFIGLFI